MSTREAAIALLEEVLNRYLRLDPDTPKRLALLHGKVIRLEFIGLGLSLDLVPGPEGLQLYSGAKTEKEADCVLRGSPLGFMRLGMGDERAGELFKGAVEIHGDFETGQRFGDMLADLEIDWEEHLSRFTGDPAAHQIGNQIRAAGRWGREAADTLSRNLQEYLQEETRLLPTRYEAEEFSDQVDLLRDDVERLAARVERLCGRPDGTDEGGA